MHLFVSEKHLFVSEKHLCEKVTRFNVTCTTATTLSVLEAKLGLNYSTEGEEEYRDPARSVVRYAKTKKLDQRSIIGYKFDLV